MRSFRVGVWWIVVMAMVSAAPAWALRVGDKMPKFSCTAIDGAQLSSSSLAGKVTAICFTASWVKRSGEELKFLQNLARDLKDKNLVILPIIEREDKTQTGAFAAKQQLTLKLLLDNGQVSQLFGVNGLPDLFIVDSTGIIRTRLVGYGPNSPDSIKKSIIPLLGEIKPVKPVVKPEPKETKPAPTTPSSPTTATSDIPPALRAYEHLQLGAAHINIGDAFINAGHSDGGHYTEAVKEMKAGLTFEPKNINLVVWLGVAYERKGEEAEAVRHYQAALALDANNSYAKEGIRRLQALPPTPPPPSPEREESED